MRTWRTRLSEVKIRPKAALLSLPRALRAILKIFSSLMGIIFILNMLNKILILHVKVGHILFNHHNRLVKYVERLLLSKCSRR